ncbi:hypothetical protein TNCV_639531 [Trichonephila clavipes]|nr:hypothetical protein TNCV_639421 [Trichonephila clavipes]GFU66519.1 hypothetical protein TNCV_639531 [Trichonephila clavipes]
MSFGAELMATLFQPNPRSEYGVKLGSGFQPRKCNQATRHLITAMSVVRRFEFQLYCYIIPTITPTSGRSDVPSIRYRLNRDSDNEIPYVKFAA